jgi:catechol 2,3-dioxygenase-like lactoylglutathione lyase family enzyme
MPNGWRHSWAATLCLLGCHLGVRGASLEAPVDRPPIIGIAHVALKTDDLAKAEAFYGHVLGFGIERGSNPAWLRAWVNEHQYIEVQPRLESPTADRLDHLAFETTSLARLREYLASRGVEAEPVPTSPGIELTPALALRDPEGHSIQFVEYEAGTVRGHAYHSHSQISDRIIHAGVTVKDRTAADRFYGDILGFRLTWQGGMTDDRTDWVDMRVPQGPDWLEYMLNVRNPSPRLLGVMHHFALGVPDIREAYRVVTQRGYQAEPPQIGRDGKWQLNLYDPNGTRAELMEPRPVRTPCCSPMRSLDGQ